MNIKSNGTFEHNGVTYHKQQYTADNPLYQTDDPNFQCSFKHNRRHVTKLYDANNKYIIKPIRINSITESANEADRKFKGHKEIAKNKSLYIKVMKFFFMRLGYYLITTGLNIKIPYVKLGSLQVAQVKEKGENRKFVNFAESKKQGKTVYERPKHWLNGYKPLLVHHALELKNNNRTLKTDLTIHSSHYNWHFVRSLIRPNSYNKTQNDVTLMNFYRYEGYKLYNKLN
jgi:hypothetical protein